MRNINVHAMHQLLALLFLYPSTLQATAALAQAPAIQQPQRRPRQAAPKPPTPLTLRQVIESLSTLRNSRRVEDQISKAGVQFEATPAVVDILKQFGASAKLISMIPVPSPSPSAPEPPVVAAKSAGPLTVVCEPKDCAVVVDDKYEGATSQNRKTIEGLRPGDRTIEIFADGYEHLTRRLALEEGKPAEERFSLKRSALVRESSAKASLLKTLASLGGIQGFAELGDVEGSGTMHWTNSAGAVEEWAMTFNKRIGRDVSVTFKTKDGQCTASILAQNAKQDCKGGLKNGGDKIAEQGTSLFLSYQLQEVIHTLLQRPLVASEVDDDHIESINATDSYVFTIGRAGLPTDLVYRIGNDDLPIQVQYSNYLNVNKGSYPGRISVGRLNKPPAWVFIVTNIRSRVVRGQ
jgi:hypothetical protein